MQRQTGTETLEWDWESPPCRWAVQMTAGTLEPEPGMNMPIPAQVWAEIAQATVTSSLSMFCNLQTFS